MTKKKVTSDTIVGLFVVLAIVAVNLVTFIIRDDIFGSSMQISATFQSVSGLEVGAPVLVSGIRGGRVSRIEYVPQPAAPLKPAGKNAVGAKEQAAEDEVAAQPVVVTMRVGGDIPIYDNAKFRLVQQGFIGDKRVEIDPGSPEGGILIKEGHPPMRGEAYFDVERVFRKAEDVVTDLQATVSSFREFATDDANVKAIRETITNMNKSVDKLHDYLVANESNVAESVANIRQISSDMKVFSERARVFSEEGGRLDKISGDAEATIAQLRHDLDELTKKAQTTVDSINKVIENTDTRSERLTTSATAFLDTTRKDFGDLSRNLQETSSNLDAVIVKIRRGEGTVGRLMTDPRPFEDLKSSITAVNNFLVGRETEYYDTSIPYDLPDSDAATSATTNAARE